MSVPKKPEPVKTKSDPRSSRLPSSEGTYPPQTGNEVPISDSQMTMEDVGSSMHVPSAALAAAITPPVSSVTITRRDPRMDPRRDPRSGVTVTQPLPEVVVPTPMAEPAVPVVPEVKGPLPMPPAPPPSIPRSMPKAAVSRCSENPVTQTIKVIKMILLIRE